jgi:hypothetical protein
LAQQIDAFLAAHSCCETCGSTIKVKGDQTRTFRTLFGTFTLSSPRLFHVDGNQSYEIGPQSLCMPTTRA